MPSVRKNLTKPSTGGSRKIRPKWSQGHPITGISFNMSDLFNRRQRRDRKHAKKMKAIFKQLDEQDNDPIVQSYRRALRNKQIKR